MDITAPLIFLAIFLLASISLFLVYKYGIKKKSYEEVLAEQRRQTSALLGPSKPTKLKEKKINKKAAKKLNKEKQASLVTSENLDITSSEDVAVKVASKKLSKIHVEFKEEPEEVEEVAVEEKKVKESSKKRSKKVKPILVKKTLDKKIDSVVEAVPVENHFEEIHPKDEFELLRCNTEAKILEQEETVQKPETPKEEKKKKRSKQPAEHAQTVEEPENVITDSSAPAPPQDAAVTVKEPKEKKKKKSEPRPPLTSDRDQLIRSVRNAELSRTEVQLLIDLLLDKQLEAPAIIDDWSEGKSDPIQKLKKQLADKEKQLNDEQDALAAIQAKLKEVRNEQSQERAQFQQKLRALEESKVEIGGALHRLQLKVQELEEARNKEAINFQRIVEENGALQLRGNQLEATLIGFQETEAMIHSLKADNLHLSKQCQLLTQQRQEQDTNYQNCLLQIQSLERNHAFDLTAQQEEIRKKHELQLHRLTENHSNEKQRLEEVIIQLKEEIQQLTGAQTNGTEEIEENEVKILNLTNELTSVRNELESVNRTLLEVENKYRKELAATLQQCGAAALELEEQKVKNDELRKKNWKVVEALNAAELRNNKTTKNADQILADELNSHKKWLRRLFPDVAVDESDSLNEWQCEFEKGVRAHFAPDPSSSDQVAKLHKEAQHYKQIIDETEGILKKLESHIEEEERNWRTKLSEKDAEIEELKNSRTSQLQIKVTLLENQLAQIQAENSRLSKVLEENRTKTISSNSSSMVVEKDLGDFLRLEQINNSEGGIYQNGATNS